MFSSRLRIALLILFLISFGLRFYLLPQNLFFGPEQGIDFAVIKNIAIQHKLTLIGAKTDISGIFHGPIYYYLSVIPFLLSRGDPLFAMAFFIALNCLTVFFIYQLGKELFNKRIGFLSALIFVFSYGSIVFSRWLSGHSLTIPLSCLLFLCIHRFLEGKKIYLLPSCILFGFLGEVEFLNFIFFGAMLFLLILIFKNKFNKQNKFFLLLCGLSLIIFSLGNYLIFDLRHNFLISKSVLQLLQGKTGYHISLERSIIDNIKAFVSAFSNFVMPLGWMLFLPFLFIDIWIYAKTINSKNRNSLIILIWLLIPLILLILLHYDVLDQFFVGIIPASIILTSVTVDSIIRKNKYLGVSLLMLILSVNIYSYFINIPQNKNIFFQSTQPELRFSDQLRAIDKIYERVNRQPFSFQSYTIPYWSQQGWEYLFWYYGKQKYGYEPVSINKKILFVIIQEDPSNKNFQNNWLENTVAKWGKWNYEFRYGILRVKELIIK